jgi:hypothetical protein
MTRCVLTAAVIYFLRVAATRDRLVGLQLSSDPWLHASAQYRHTVKRLTRRFVRRNTPHTGT